jgi:hypothetical protein
LPTKRFRKRRLRDASSALYPENIHLKVRE